MTRDHAHPLLCRACRAAPATETRSPYSRDVAYCLQCVEAMAEDDWDAHKGQRRIRRGENW
jgi:hypothetical protein